MSRPRTSSKPASSRRRTRRKGVVHVFRGMVLESMGVAVLVFLYLTIQAAPSQPALQNQISTQPAKNEPAGNQTQITGHYASSWADYNRKTKSHLSQPGVLGSWAWTSGQSSR